MAKPKSVSRRQFLTSSSAGLLAGAGALSGFGTARAQGRRDLRIGLFGEPPGLNEFRRTDIQGSPVTGSIYHRLAETNYEKGVPDPVLAEGWTQEGPTKWLVKLRPGIKWHKGYGEITAEDVAYTVNYTVENKTFQFGSGTAGVKSNRPRQALVEYELCGFGAFANVNPDYGGTITCKKAHEEMGERNYSAIRSARALFSSWVSGSHIVQEGEGLRGARARRNFEEVTWRFMPDLSVRRRAGEGRGRHLRQADWVAREVPPGQVKGFGTPRRRAGTGTTSPSTIRRFRTTSTLKQEVRQAISYAIDREALVKEITTATRRPRTARCRRDSRVQEAADPYPMRATSRWAS
jgi:peptide/nickel transport system substrate-binding protein